MDTARLSAAELPAGTAGVGTSASAGSALFVPVDEVVSRKRVTVAGAAAVALIENVERHGHRSARSQ